MEARRHAAGNPRPDEKAAAEIGDLALGTMPLAGTLKNGWVIPPYHTGNAGADYLSRLDVAVFGLTANTTAQAIYYSGVLDGENKPTTGEKKYTLTLTPPMEYAKPVPPGFWSVTMYDRRTNYTAPNPINRYHLADYDDLKENADGSITLYLQTESPGKDKESNWLPSPPGPFYLIMRNYAPSPECWTSALGKAAMFNRLALAWVSKSFAVATAVLAVSGGPASAWTSDDTASAATLLDGVLRLFGDVAGAAQQAQAADIEADRHALMASGGCVVTDVQVALKQVWGHDEAVKRFYELVNNGAIARHLWAKCRPALRVSTWELSAVQQVVVNVWNAGVAEENARIALANEIAQYDRSVDREVATAVDQGIRDHLRWPLPSSKRPMSYAPINARRSLR